MADKDKKNNGDRLLVFEPNPEDNRIFSNEDLSINVELNTFKKNRSIINSGIVTNTSDGGKNGPIKFIGGSKTGEDEKTGKPIYNLTTNYTNATTSFDKKDSGRDLETLGIENIHINFDTAYTPKITIKFVDIRGNAIFQQGNDSKYSAFFEMPYPIFELKVKGFYGKPVTYCLHMYKWNSNFNSETGNFEIKAEFIGYTYALLTDMLLGLIRAVIKTNRGKKIWAEEQQKDPSLTSIDEFMDNVDKLGEEFDKIKNEDTNLTRIEESKLTLDLIQRLEDRFNSLMKSMLDGKEFIHDKNNGIVVTTAEKAEEQALIDLIESDKKGLVILLDGDESTGEKGANSSIENDDFKIDSNEIIDFKTNGIGPFSGGTGQLEETKIASKLVELDNEKFSGEDNKETEKMVSFITDYGQAVDFHIFDLTKQFKILNELKENIEKRNKETTEKLAKDLAKSAENSLNFRPTVRNIVKMLVKHSEVFLKVLKDVSDEAYKSTSRSKKIIKKLDLKTSNTDSGINQNNTKTENAKIYPWPEYFEKTTNSDGETIQEESWIGNKILPGTGMIEVDFVEELLELLLKDFQEDEEELNQNLNLTEVPNYYPISPLDTNIPQSSSKKSYITQNPYKTALSTDEGNKTITEEAIKTLMLRAWLGLSFSNPSRISGPMKTAMGQIEAENLYNALLDINNDKKRQIIQQIQNIEKAEDIINSYDILGSTNNKNMMSSFRITTAGAGANLSLIENGEDVYYRYRYLITDPQDADEPSTAVAILPINKGFNGKKFKSSTNELKLKSFEELVELRDDYFFIDNSGNSQLNQEFPLWDKFIEPGCEFFKILHPSDYNGLIQQPDFAQTTFTEISKNLLSFFQGTNSVINDLMVLQQSTLKNPSYNDVNYKPNSLKLTEDTKYKPAEPLFTYGGRLKAMEILNINYDSTVHNNSSYLTPQNKHYRKRNMPDGISDVLCAYWAQPKMVNTSSLIPSNPQSACGTYLSRGFKEGAKNKAIAGATYTWKSNFEYDINNDNSLMPDNYTLSKTQNQYRILPEDYGKQRELLGLVNGEAANLNANSDNKVTSAYFPYIEFNVQGYTGTNSYVNNNLSLFGSRFYYEQETNKARAFLFLHTFGFQGIVGDIKDYRSQTNTFGESPQVQPDVSLFDRTYIDTTGTDEETSFKSYDESPTIKGLFNNYASFIKAPRLWCAFIGGLLSRYEEKFDIRFTSKVPDANYPYLIPWMREDTPLPNKNQYLIDVGSLAYDNGKNQSGMNIGTEYVGMTSSAVKYAGIDSTLLRLPQSVKDEFIRIFDEFVLGELSETGEAGFQDVRKQFELMYTKDPKDFSTGGAKGWEQLHDNLVSAQHRSNPGVAQPNYLLRNPNQTKFTVGKLKEIFTETNTSGPRMSKDGDGLKNMTSIVAIRDLGIGGLTDQANTWGFTWPQKKAWQINIVYRRECKGSDLMRDLVSQYKWVMNGKPQVFRSSELRFGLQDGQFLKKVDLLVFLDGFLAKFKTLSKDFDKQIEQEKDKLEQQIFKTIDDDTIKLTIYRELSSIYNKWIAGAGATSSTSCAKSASKNGLFNSFKFIDRSYNDIGDKFFINPFTVKELMLGKPNTNLFTLLDVIFKDNNFNFIPLPTYIDYSKPKDVLEVFKPYPYSKSFDTNQGPSFVCMYVGQTSNSLDLGNNSQYPDDSFTVLDSGNKGYIMTNVPDDFKTSRDKDGRSLNIPYFLVSYGRQNQSIFKSLKLDQNEFTSTLESLNVVEDLSQLGDKTKPTYKGQNLWNVYQNRAYSCEIEMMGNSMIQPFMYFQLSNVPMFRGAYSIFKVTHSITPHNMKTNFKGVRIKKTRTPLITEVELYSNLLSYLNSTIDSSKETRNRNIKYTLMSSPGGIVI